MLIDKSELLKAYDAAHKGPPGGARKLIEEAPAVPAVPLDKLCEWLAERYEPPYTLIDIDKLKAPIDFRQQKEIWLVALTKWMEEQDADD